MKHSRKTKKAIKKALAENNAVWKDVIETVMVAQSAINNLCEVNRLHAQVNAFKIATNDTAKVQESEYIIPEMFTEPQAGDFKPNAVKPEISINCENDFLCSEGFKKDLDRIKNIKSVANREE